MEKDNNVKLLLQQSSTFSQYTKYNNGDYFNVEGFFGSIDPRGTTHLGLKPTLS